MNCYCPQNGHRVSYDATKPEKCPVCGCAMTPPKVAVAAIQSDPPAKQPWPKRAQFDERGDPIENRQPARVPVYSGGEDGLGDMEFDSASIRVEGEADRPMTVKELHESGTAVERREESGGSVAGGERVTTAELVKQMIAQDGGGQVASAAVAKPRRARSGGSRKSGGGKGAGA